MKLLVTAALLTWLCGCAQNQTAAAQTVFAAASALDLMEKLAASYELSPTASAAAVAKIKQLDSQAYAAVAPLTVDGNDVTADQAFAAQAAVMALDAALVQAGASK